MDRISLTTLEFLVPVLIKFLRAAVIILIALIATRFVRRFIRALRLHIFGLMQRRAPVPDTEMEKRAATLAGIVQKTAAVLIWAVATIMVLKEGGFDIAPILAGAGVAGLAVGFGAQNLVRDVISGLFILLENQIRVNDVAVINGTGGLVEEINLRTTVLRSMDGAVHIFPNGAIERLSNLTLEYSYYVFDIGVAYNEDTDRVSEVVKSTAAELMSDPAYRDDILAPIEILGVDKFGESAVILKARMKTRPVQQWKVGREMNRRLKKKFDEVGIEIPYPHQSLYFGEVTKPLRVQLEHSDQEDLKRLVREIVKEITDAQSGAAVNSEVRGKV